MKRLLVFLVALLLLSGAFIVRKFSFEVFAIYALLAPIAYYFVSLFIVGKFRK
jgi:hypothetical protein